LFEGNEMLNILYYIILSGKSLEGRDSEKIQKQIDLGWNILAIFFILVICVFIIFRDNFKTLEGEDSICELWMALFAMILFLIGYNLLNKRK